MTISAELSGALRYCGDIRGERIHLPDLYTSWLNSCLLLDADLEISESWRQVTVRDLDIAEREQSLASQPNFAFEIGLDYRAIGSEDPWKTLQIVAPERVADAESRGEYVASFYGQPRKVILSFDPVSYEFRLWSVSGTADRGSLSEVSGLPETYRPLRELLTAHERLADCRYDADTYDRYMDVIKDKLQIWMPRWERFKNKPLKREGSRRPGFKSSRRGFSRPYITR
jgi:hypothetical protein